ncbi:MAG TPA: hypothetical protein VHM48_02220 [Candidatus Limnocylindrales bacterium]|nr:hypothetical protein [Candidatus Limnocylindrales bacterium]
MSGPRADDSFEIPIERLAEGRGQRRRAAIAVASLAIVVGGAIGLARLAESRATQIILVDLADRTRITAITLPMNGPASIIAVELRP